MTLINPCNLSCHTCCPRGPTFIASECSALGTPCPASARLCTSCPAKWAWRPASSRVQAVPSLSPARPVRPTLQSGSHCDVCSDGYIK
jgi:hypothetical protein